MKYDKSLNEVNENVDNCSMFDQDFDLGLEILEVDGSTVLEEMGASIGFNSCSSVVKLGY